MATKTAGKRRNRGDRSVFQRSDGRWAAKIRLGEVGTGTTGTVRGLGGGPSSVGDLKAR